MKRIFMAAVLAVLIAVPAIAGNEEVSFGWDKNTESDLAGYRLYFSQTPGVYVKKATSATTPNLLMEIPVTASSHPNTATHAVSAADGAKVYFVLTAYDLSGNESGFSNEVTYTMTDQTAPAAPKGFWARLSKLLAELFDMIRGGFRIG